MTSSQQTRRPDSEGGSTDDIIKHVNDQQMNRNGLTDDQHNVTDDGSSKQKGGWKTYYKRNSVYGKRKSNEKID